MADRPRREPGPRAPIGASGGIDGPRDREPEAVAARLGAALARSA